MGDWDDSIKIFIRENAQDLVTWLWKEAHVKRHLQTEYKVRTIEADSVLEIELENNGKGMLFHIEIQSTRDPNMAERLLQYSVEAQNQHKLPVYSCVIYLRDVGDVPQPPLRWQRLDGQDYLVFDYLSIELATIPVEELKQTGLVGLKPLFVLARGGTDPAVVKEVVTDLGEAQQFGLLSISKLFADLVFTDENQEWVERIFAMYSDPLAQTRTYQKLVKQGRDEGLQEGLQKALVEFIEARFPSLSDLARKNVPQVAKPDALNLLIKATAIAPDESVVRVLLESAAA